MEICAAANHSNLNRSGVEHFSITFFEHSTILREFTIGNRTVLEKIISKLYIKPNRKDLFYSAEVFTGGVLNNICIFW